MLLLGFAGLGFMAYRERESQHWWPPDPRSSGFNLKSRLRGGFFCATGALLPLLAGTKPTWPTSVFGNGRLFSARFGLRAIRKGGSAEHNYLIKQFDH